MTGDKKGQKKRNRITLRVRFKENSVKKRTYTLKVLIIFSNIITSQSSGTSEVFRFLLFKYYFSFLHI